MRILFLTQWFQPEPSFKGIPFAKALQKCGHNIEVLTGFPNYPEGKLYPGYHISLYKQEEIDGIPIHRVPLYPSHDDSGTKRIMNYLSFSLSSAVLGPFLVHRPDIVYVYNLVTLVPAAWIIQFLHSCPVVIDVQDLWPDSVQNSGMIKNTAFNAFLNQYCLKVYRKATHLVTLSHGMKAELIKRGVQKKRISAILNWCNENHIGPMAKDIGLSEKLGLAGNFNVMFAGTMGVMQGLATLLEAASILKAEYPNIKIILVGDGIEHMHLKNLARQKELTNVLFLDRQPRETISRILSLADTMIVHLKDKPFFRFTIPSKLQAYMAAAKPIIMAVHGEAADIIHASGGGIVVEPESPEALARGIIEMYGRSEAELESMGKAGSLYYQKSMSMSSGVNKFDNLFRALRKH